MPLFAVAVFLSSFLLFAVQPMVAKFLLPAFGGTAAVWATCLVFFQLLLLAGYSYAHLLRTVLSPLAQRWTHLALLTVSLLFLPPAPAISAAANTTGTPVWELLRALLTSVGLPFFALSATAPLLMEWFRHYVPGRSPDRLYAFSNAGSLLALLAYPALLEPNFTRLTQSSLWAAGMGAFVAVCAAVAWQSRPARRTGPEHTPPLASARGAPPSPPQEERAGERRPPARDRPRSTMWPMSWEPMVWLWIALPACGSALLLALTNQISQDVAPMPLLWVAPMSVYLITFILCFEGPRSYRRGLFIPASFAGFLLLAWLLDQGYRQGFWAQVGSYLGVLFLGCMVCHGELYRLRPRAEKLTAYYLCISLGGALGGIFVALIAPAIFRTLLETPLIGIAVPGLATFILWREAKLAAGTARGSARAKRLPNPPVPRPFDLRPVAAHLTATLAIALALGYVWYDSRQQSIYFARSFYGAYRVKETSNLLLDGIDYPLTPGTARVLLSGQIYHGLQFTNSDAAKLPTTYYSEEGGLGLAFRELPSTTNRYIGAIGLGAGTLAAYARPGDRVRFYELNPDVLRIAQTYFTFLTNCPAQVDVVLGDGRLSLAREPNQAFDLLVLDAFAGDSIPMHLLTDQAMAVYQRHLKPDGVMAFHISNSHLDLEPVVRALAQKHGFQAIFVPPRSQEPRFARLASFWMLLSSSDQFCSRPAIVDMVRSVRPPEREPLLWTDDYSSILPILH